MLKGWLRQLSLKAQVKAGFSTRLAVWFIVAAIASMLAVLFLAIAAFIWLADLYTPLIASLIMAGFFVLVVIIGIIACVAIRSRNMKEAQRELAARNRAGSPGLLGIDPQLLTVGLQIGRNIGWGKLVTVAAVGIVAAGLAKEWFGRDDDEAASDEPPDEP